MKKIGQSSKILTIIGSIVLLFIVIGGFVYEANAATIRLPFFLNMQLDKLPQRKLERILKLQQKIEKGRLGLPKTVLPHNSKRILPSLGLIPTPMSGILNLRQGPFSSVVFTIRNIWQGRVGDKWVTVYAGGTPKDPSTGNTTPVNGAIRVYSRFDNSSLSFVGTFSAPSGNGPLTVVDVNGPLLKLTSETGGTLTFNIQTNQFK